MVGRNQINSDPWQFHIYYKTSLYHILRTDNSVSQTCWALMSPSILVALDLTCLAQSVPLRSSEAS
jgi:hypothetical protein